MTDLIYDGQRFVAIQFNGYSLSTVFLTSTNGSNWISSGFLTNWITSIAHSTENYVGVGRGVIYGSLDAARWSFELATPPSRWVGVAFGGGTFVAVSDEGAILQSDIRTLPYLTLSTEGLGKVVANPDQKDYQTGDTVTLTAAPDRWFTFAQWTDGATSNPRTIRVNASPLANNYIAVFRPAVPLETVSLGSVSRLAPIGTPAILVDGQFVPDGVVSRLDIAMIQIQSTFTNGLVLYSVDGSEPSVSGRIYAGAFNISRDATIRARAYSADFARAADSDPVRVEFVSRPASFTLSVAPSGGGEVLLNPSGGNYSSNVVVTVTAVPDSGWQLVQWLGDVATTNPTSTRRKSCRSFALSRRLRESRSPHLGTPRAPMPGAGHGLPR